MDYGRTYPDDWKIAVHGRRVRIDFRGQHYHTRAEFLPDKDHEGITRPNRSAEGLASWWRFAVACYGHPYANDHNPAPPIIPEPEPPLNATERRQRFPGP